MPSDNEDEKEMEARFERETATAEEWVDVVVDVVGELEDLLDDGDGYDADDDADESKGGQSFRDAINALERRAIEGEDWGSDEHSLSHRPHGEFRKPSSWTPYSGKISAPWSSSTARKVDVPAGPGLR